jgi:hypothetical protein
MVFHKLAIAPLFQAARAKTLFEAVDTSTSLSHFLAAGVKRVAGRTDIKVDIATQGRAGNNNIAAAAFGSDLGILWMDIGFHV